MSATIAIVWRLKAAASLPSVLREFALKQFEGLMQQGCKRLPATFKIEIVESKPECAHRHHCNKAERSLTLLLRPALFQGRKQGLFALQVK